MTEGGATLRRALAALEMRRHEEAAELAGLAIVDDPRSALAHGVLAGALLGLGRDDTALEAALGGLAADGEDEWLHRLRALALAGLGRGEEALAAADEATRLAPSAPTGPKARAVVLERLGRIPEARAPLDRVLELDPGDSDARRRWGDTWLYEDAERAAGAYREALAIDPRDALALNNLGVALSRLGRGREATVAFTSAILVDPTLPEARQNAHGSVAERLRWSGRWLLAAVVGARLAYEVAGLLGAPPGGTVGAGVATAAGLVALAWGLRRREERLLFAADPLVGPIWKQLQADKRAGRL